MHSWLNAGVPTGQSFPSPPWPRPCVTEPEESLAPPASPQPVGQDVKRRGFPGGSDSMEPACNAEDPGSSWFKPWVWKIPRKREWLLTPVVPSGELHGQRSLVGYSPLDGKESDSTE